MAVLFFFVKRSSLLRKLSRIWLLFKCQLFVFQKLNTAVAKRNEKKTFPERKICAFRAISLRKNYIRPPLSIVAFCCFFFLVALANTIYIYFSFDISAFFFQNVRILFFFENIFYLPLEGCFFVYFFAVFFSSAPFSRAITSRYRDASERA